MSERFEKEVLIESVVLRLYAEWMGFVEEVMVECLNRDSTRYADYAELDLPKHMDGDMCRAALYGIQYQELGEIGKISDYSRKVLVPSCNPFLHIPAGSVRALEELAKIRNHLAHYSAFAERVLRRKIYRDRFRFKRFREPGAVLLSRDEQVRLPRFFRYIVAFLDAALSMAKFLDVDLSRWTNYGETVAQHIARCRGHSRRGR